MIFNELSATEVFFGSSEYFSNAIVIKFIMKDFIDAERLDNAVQKAIVRYPYFSITAYRNKDDKIEIVHNDRKVLVTDKDESFELFTEKVNYHMQYITYNEKTINFCISHAFCDANSFLKYIHTVLYIYITDIEASKHGKVIDKNGVWLPGEELFEDEDKDPLEDIIKMDKQEEKEKGTPLLPGTFHMYSIFEDPERELNWYAITLPQDKFVKLAKEKQTGPAALLTGIVMKAISELEFRNLVTIKAGIMINPRDVIGCPNARHFLAYGLSILFLPQDCNDEKIYLNIRKVVKTTKKEKSLYALQEKAYKAKSILDLETNKGIMTAQKETIYCDAPTFITSYVGRLNWGNLEGYIDKIFLLSKPLYAPVVEMMAVNDLFTISVTQPFKSDLYVKLIAKQLEENGIECSLSEEKPLKMPWFASDKLRKLE